jgi:dolichyl-phosphate beta-glucosyltransferase
MLKTVLAAALLITFIKLLLWCTAPLRSSRDTALDEDAREAWLKRRPKEQVQLSIVVPAYDEAERLPPTLRIMELYLRNRRKDDATFTFEIIVVDDGSNDATAATAASMGAQLFPENNLVVVRLPKNRGKGGAVKEGVLRSRGAYVLLADADGATDIRDHATLEARALAGDCAVVCGSRAHLVDTAVVARRSMVRNILMRGFHAVVQIVGGVEGVRDTQCGFKLFRRREALVLFKQLHLERWAFDVEILYVALALRYKVAEVPVTWTEVPGSKVDLVRDSLRMARDIACVRLAYLGGLWRLPQSR